MLMWVAKSLHPARCQQLPKLITANPTSYLLVKLNSRGLLNAYVSNEMVSGTWW